MAQLHNGKYTHIASEVFNYLDKFSLKWIKHFRKKSKYYFTYLRNASIIKFIKGCLEVDI